MSRIFQRALGCICTVFRSCDCSTSRSRRNPARSGKKSHKSLRVSSNCHVWLKRWTNTFQDFYQMYPMRLDVHVLPLPESVLNSTCRNVWDLDFKNWVVPWVFSLLNGLTLTQITVLSVQNMWLHIQRMVVETGDLFWVCCWSQHREDQNLLWMWIGRNSTKRDT